MHMEYVCASPMQKMPQTLLLFLLHSFFSIHDSLNPQMDTFIT